MWVVGGDDELDLQISSTASTCATEVSMNHTNLIPFNVSHTHIVRASLSPPLWFVLCVCQYRFFFSPNKVLLSRGQYADYCSTWK